MHLPLSPLILSLYLVILSTTATPLSNPDLAPAANPADEFPNVVHTTNHRWAARTPTTMVP